MVQTRLSLSLCVLNKEGSTAHENTIFQRRPRLGSLCLTRCWCDALKLASLRQFCRVDTSQFAARFFTTKTLGHSTVSKDCSAGRRPLNALPSSAEKRTVILITNTHIKEKEAGLRNSLALCFLLGRLLSVVDLFLALPWSAAHHRKKQSRRHEQIQIKIIHCQSGNLPPLPSCSRRHEHSDTLPILTAMMMAR
jgi:hypothetical protein